MMKSPSQPKRQAPSPRRHPLDGPRRAPQRAEAVAGPLAGHLLAGAALGLAALVATPPARAAEVAFVEVSSERRGGPESPVWNAVDGKDATAWCSTTEDATPVVSFGFDAPVTITHVGLVVGALEGGALAKDTRQGRAVSIQDASHRVEMQFREVPTLQVLEIKPPMKGRRVTLEFPGVIDGVPPETPLCVAEIVLKSKDTVLTGAAVAARARAVSPAGRKLLHEWLDDPSAPQRTLLFDMDGTFAFTYTPLLEGKQVSLRGRWSATDRAVTLEAGGRSWRLNSRLTLIDDGESKTTELVLEGEGPNPAVVATYRPAPARPR